MRNTPLNNFVEQVMKIEADYAGMNGASAGILGATGTNVQIVYDLRGNVLVFANEYVRRPLDKERISELSRQLEGSLRAVKLVGGVSDSKLEELLSKLSTLMNELVAR